MITDDLNIEKRVFVRGFILSEHKQTHLNAKLSGKPYAQNLEKWTKTFFGPCTLWVDPLLNYAVTSDNRFGVGVMGLCINPFDGKSDNQSISNALYESLKQGRDAFFDYVDSLSGSFLIVYRENADVYLLQDTAGTKPVYYHRDASGHTTASGHSKLLSYICDLSPDPRVDIVFGSKAYTKDPSRYLPGMITPYEKALPLTANNQLSVKAGESRRFFPREDLTLRAFDDQIVNEIAEIMVRQARMIAAFGRPMMLAATGGRDSRGSAASFSGLPNQSYFSFHMPRTGHLSEDVRVARQLADAGGGVPLHVYNLELYDPKKIQKAFGAHSPRGIWPAAALCYIQEFSPDAIHIRSTVSEIGRIFYTNRSNTTVTPITLSRSYTGTEFYNDPIVTSTMEDFINHTEFTEKKFFNYNIYDMFYWEHRNSKWQNILCSEAEMAGDVFIPYNNRKLLQLFMSIPYENRLHADVHKALCNKLQPRFQGIEFS